VGQERGDDDGAQHVGGGTNPTQLPTTTTEYDWWGNTAKVTETANGVTRITTAHDDAGRPTTVRTTGGVGQAVPEATTEYDPAIGQAVRTISTPWPPATTSPPGGGIDRFLNKGCRQRAANQPTGNPLVTSGLKTPLSLIFNP
jgi:hypothetical protein